MEEPREQNKIAKVHRKAEMNIHAGNVAVHLAALQILVRRYVNEAANNHLQELQRSDHHRNRLRRSVSHCFQRIVGIHDRVHAVVHYDVPSRGRGVFRIREPGIQ